MAEITDVYRLDADTSDYARAMEEVQRDAKRAAETMARAFQEAGEGVTKTAVGLAGRFSGVGTAIATAAARFSPILGAVTALGDLFQTAQSRVTELGSRVTELGPKFGESASDAVDGFSKAFEEAQAAANAAARYAAEWLGFGQALAWVANQAKAVADELRRAAESALPPERRSNDALRRQIEELRALVADGERLLAGGGAMAGPARLAQPGLILELRELERQLAERERTGSDVGHLQPSEIDRQIEAMRRQTTEMRIQAETFGMGAEAAARYRAEQLALEAMGGRQLTALDPAKLEEWRKAVDALAEQRAELEDEQRSKREAERRETIVTGMDREIEALQRQTRALTMTAGAAAELNFQERELLRFQQARLEPTEEDERRIEERARQYRATTEALNELKKRRSEIQAYSAVFSRSIESAFTGWISGAKVSWREFANDLSRQIAKLALQFAVLQPLFGGGGTPGAGLFGQLFGLPGRAAGGPVSAGQPYMVGERGRELFVPRQSGTIVPNHALGGGGGATINMRLDLTGANGNDTIAAIAGAAARAAALQAVQASNAGFATRQHSLRMLGT